MAPETRLSKVQRGVLFALLAGFALNVLRSAWVCDDAYITFRTVDNLANGWGLTWNPDERVQAFTNTLWMFAVAIGHALTGEVYYTSLLLALACSIAAAGLVAFRASTFNSALVALVVMAGSKAFVDFSTSGLENPLLHLLLVALLIVYMDEARTAWRRAFFIGLCVSGVFLTRPDALVLVAPPVAFRLWSERSSRSVVPFVLGLAPLFLWEFFSLLYYGFPFPNTAYAKLSSGLPPAELFGQGLRYLGSSVALDKLTPFAIAAGIVAAFASRNRALAWIGMGICLHVLYVVKIGGDFMSGRFLTVPLLASAFVLARTNWTRGRASFACGAALALALLAPLSPLRAPTAYGLGSSPPDHIDDAGITDERAYWFHYTGLFSPNRDLEAPPIKHVTKGHAYAARLREKGRQVLIGNGIGMLGYFAGPLVHILDPMGLADPLLARMPIAVDGVILDPEGNRFRERAWRIAHFTRPMPEGYLKTLESGENHIEPTELAGYYERLALVTRGALWAPGRVSAILALNLPGARAAIRESLETR